MTQFVQLHLLTSYPPANLNRDDLGRPKTAMMGGTNRLRISSQSLKRAWRTSDTFQHALASHIGVRTKEMGVKVYHALLEKDIKEKQARDWAKSIAAVFGKLKTAKKSDNEEGTSQLIELETEQLAHFSPEEQKAIENLIDELVSNGKAPDKEQLLLLRHKHTAADIALFGRMLASQPGFNTEAAAQVAHAITIHKVSVEDDFFTAVDDLNRGEEDAGAGHIGETEFAAGLFYLYLCIDCDQLVSNLSDDQSLADQTMAALIQSAATVAPTGKQNSFASRARASYILCERGDSQPRSLSVAFLKPVSGSDMLESGIAILEETKLKMDNAYGDGANASASMNATTGEGNLKEIIDCATSRD
ncbi:MAG: type I-E CRISPR-associated protein Cas7/Cse4/CasC [marine bacterium B5-7]|nr:MAG: type I-E CRISPR-associated protein Cas7/Cse4/CasC [marine bacterium B5-7]